MDEEKRIWTPTNHAHERDVAIWKFSGGSVYVLAGSFLAGLFVGYRLVVFGLPMASSFMIASFIPLITAIFLVKLVIDKPLMYFADWLEWKYIKQTNSALLNLDKIKNTDNES